MALQQVQGELADAPRRLQRAARLVARRVVLGARGAVRVLAFVVWERVGLREAYRPGPSQQAVLDQLQLH